MTCPDCLRPLATEQDYDTIPEGEGRHLCWRAWYLDTCPAPLQSEDRYRDLERNACEVCGVGAKLERHHLAPVAVFGDDEAERWPTVMVCQPCHRRWHKMMKGDL